MKIPGETFRIGFNEQVPYAEPTHFYLSIGEAITEAFGRSGSSIVQLTFGVTPNPANNAEPKFYSCGGFSGGAFDATPSPDLNGPCSLVGISGQTSAPAGNIALDNLEFRWSCVGKPTSYNK